MTTTHPSANDSGLNLDRLEALPMPDLRFHAEFCRGYAVAKGDMLELARAALANQPAPTVPALDDLMTYPSPHGTLVRLSDVKCRVAHQPAQEQAEPLDMPLPCDITVGAGTIRKGVKLRALVARMESLHRMALNAMPEPTPEARAMIDSMIAGTWDGAAQEPVAAPQQAKSGKDAVIDLLLDVARLAYDAMDNTEDNGDFLKWNRPDFDALSAAMDRLDDLPDDQPGYVMEPAAKARWAMRPALAAQQAAAPANSVEFDGIKTSAPGTPEAPKKPAHGHRDDYYLLANGRRLGLEPISRVRNMPNWVLAMELFATGGGSAYQICRDAGVDPEGTTIQRTAQLDGGRGEGQ